MEAASDRETDAPESANLKVKDIFLRGCHETSHQEIVDIQTLDAQTINRCATSLDIFDPLGSNPQYRVDNVDLVEELILKNYKNSNLFVTGSGCEETQIRQGQLQHLDQQGGGSVKRSSLGDCDVKGNQFDTSVGAEDARNTSFAEISAVEHISNRVCNKKNEQLTDASNSNTISNDSLLFSGGIRTKFLSSSGASHFLVKNSLKGKGVVCKYPVAREGFDVVSKGQSNKKVDGVASPRVASDALHLSSKASDSINGGGPNSLHDGRNLADWLKPGHRRVDKVKSLCIFRQIVQLVDIAHSKQIVLRSLRPSCFKLMPSNKVKYIGLSGQNEYLESIRDLDTPLAGNHLSTKRNSTDDMHSYSNLTSKHQKVSDNMGFGVQYRQFPARSGFIHDGFRISSVGVHGPGQDTGEKHNSNSEYSPGNALVSNTARPQLISSNVELEDKWYTSPEELHEPGSTYSSNIYSLGILLFELLSCSESWEVHTTAMLKLQHRILPPNFLSENPKEAGFCLWLLHPEPSSRPTTRELLQSELICDSKELMLGDQLSSFVDEDDTESELLSHFLESLKEQKHKKAAKLYEEIESLETDIEEIERRYLQKTNGVLSLKQSNSSNNRDREFLINSESLSALAPVLNIKEGRLTRNMNQLENAYFSVRSQIQHPDAYATYRLDIDLLKNRSRCSPMCNDNRDQVMAEKPKDQVGAFFDGLCKFARYSKLEIRGTLRNGDLLNSMSANVICSMSFDRDEDFFATAGVSKKIKIFDYHSLLDDSIDLHYPMVEMSSKSKLSCVCWNSYIKNYLASTDYDGVVQLWDASTGQGFAQYREHERRAWSVDFSPVDPRKLVSGSDDCSVRLWTINERKSLGTIRNVANVCCVQFSSHSTNLLAFGSADYKTYCYDLRHTRMPWCILAGHGKTVSYVKFLDEETLVSASTDNTLKLWDLNKTSSNAVSTNACSSTFRGHTNEKNFVGLAVSDGYIACGSETNEVYAYYKSFSMPITSHKFGSLDPISGQETNEDNGQFVSSVCWRKESNMVLAANSSGTIKLLQMV